MTKKRGGKVPKTAATGAKSTTKALRRLAGVGSSGSVARSNAGVDALAGVQAAQAANMRCIAVETTLSEAILKDAGPSMIRDNIGNISINDILTSGSNSTGM
ncbi:hypothetical protein AALP_AA2G087100 [Arabis alpina]|uniref:Uncharacterized protein n=1 Tax=Arabis alpina TaxID=50452 RepID=A0A087HG57_ARAAL|nr:hypothetical protein AALP_AA2G087100 [Arabis alpina]